MSAVLQPIRPRRPRNLLLTMVLIAVGVMIAAVSFVFVALIAVGPAQVDSAVVTSVNTAP
jgi:hypothetical protein